MGDNNMRSRQSGVSLSGLLVVLVILVVLGLLALKVVPPYMEFRTAKNAIEAVARERQGASVNDVRRAFDARAQIDDINSIKAQDLEVTKNGQDIVISFAYRKEVHLFRNVGLYFDFAASAGAQ
jgi:Tfp pilus assembly protein FimT